jgi:hypothetical protein
MNAVLAILSPVLLLTALSYFWARLAVKASGWDDLATQYRWPAPFNGASCSHQTLRFPYGLFLWRSVTVKANEEGILLEPLFPYAHVAPRVRIPWTDLRLSRTGEVRCSAAPKVRMWVNRSLQKRITSYRHEFEPPSAAEPS